MVCVPFKTESCICRRCQSACLTTVMVFETSDKHPWQQKRGNKNRFYSPKGCVISNFYIFTEIHMENAVKICFVKLV